MTRVSVVVVSLQPISIQQRIEMVASAATVVTATAAVATAVLFLCWPFLHRCVYYICVVYAFTTYIEYNRMHDVIRNVLIYFHFHVVVYMSVSTRALATVCVYML